MPRYAFRTQESTPFNSRSRIEATQARGPSLEQDYPRVLQAIQSMWGYKELNLYFRKLTIDERGNREGFPPEVWNEIYMLQHLHQELVREPIYFA